MKFFSYCNFVAGNFVRHIYFSLSFSVAANLKKVIDDPPSSKSMMFPLVSIAVQPCVHRPTNFPFCVPPPSLYLSSPGSRKIRDPVQIHLIGIRGSPDHRSVGNREVKFIGICSLDGAETVSVVRIREGPYYRGVFFVRKYMRILSGH